MLRTKATDVVGGTYLKAAMPGWGLGLTDWAACYPPSFIASAIRAAMTPILKEFRNTSFNVTLDEE